MDSNAVEATRSEDGSPEIHEEATPASGNPTILEL